MRHRMLLVTALVFPGLVAQSGHAQTPEIEARLRQIFASGEFAARQRFGPARWVDATAYLTIEPSPAVRSGRDLVRYDAATGARSVLVAADRLVPAGATEPLAVEDYSLSADGKRLLIFTNSRQVWRQNTRGDYWVLDLAQGPPRKLGGPDAPESSLMYAKFSPAGDKVAYVRQGEVYVEQLGDGRITKLTSGADSLHVNGMSDWVYEEEFDLRDGFRWSPDGNRIAYWRFDMTGVGTFRLINDTDSLYPRIIPIQYPKAGTANSAVSAGVVSATGGPTTWIALGDDLRENYLPRMEWAGPNDLVLQRMNRLQNVNRLLLASAATGAVTPVLTEPDSAWVDVVDDLTWLAKGTEFLWPSERDGWRHFYRVSRDGKKLTLLTPGNFDAISLAGVDEAGGWLYYYASPENATQRYLYRGRLEGKGTPERISPVAQPGSHNYQVAPGAQWAFHRYSTRDRPAVVELVRLATHQVVRTLVNDSLQRAAVARVITRPTEAFQVPVGNGLMVDGWMIRPRDFDSTKTYPVLVYVYGEPAGQTVIDSWSGGTGLWHHLLADQGYIVVSFDNRGTPAPRGRAWRKSVYGAIGILSSQDQAEAVRALTRARPYLDASRVAIWGWSGGGSSTLLALFRYPEVYAVGMSVAPVPDQSLYDTIYQERYMGLPTTNAEAYRKASAINVAEGLRGKLLIVHGSGDDNVHYQGSERLVNRLIQLGKRFDFMTYPNRSHCICEGQGTTLHVYSLLTRYLLEHLPAGPRSTVSSQN